MDNFVGVQQLGQLMQALQAIADVVSLQVDLPQVAKAVQRLTDVTQCLRGDVVPAQFDQRELLISLEEVR